MGWMTIIYNGEEGVAGDSVWDIMDAALDSIVKEYQEEWNRPPSTAELFSILKFCLGGHEEIKEKDIKEVTPNADSG